MNANAQPDGGEPSDGPAARRKPFQASHRYAIPWHSIIGGVARYWWRILLLWLLISAPAAYLIFVTVLPVYEAVSRIRIEPAQPDLYDPLRRATADDARIHAAYLRTQVNLVTSDQVLGRAVASQSVAGLPMIRNSEDPNADLRERIVVEIEPGTYIVKIALQSPDANEAAAIVNAVADSYLDENLRYAQSWDAALKASLSKQLRSLSEKIERKKAELRELHRKGNVQVSKPSLNVNAPNTADDDSLPAFTAVDEQRLGRVIGAMVQNDLDLLAARAALAVKREGQKQADGGAPPGRQSDQQLEDRVKLLQKTKESYARMYEKLQVQMKAGDTPSFESAQASQELASLLAREEQVKRHLAQIEFQSRQEPYRVILVDKAQVPTVPASNKRWAYMTIALGGVLFELLGTFLLVEFCSARVYDPDELSVQSGLDVYPLPALPTSQLRRRRGSPDVDWQIELFINEVDNVCLAVCGNQPKRTLGLCVVVTSAIGGEGKTTLAAQLAAGCGYLGMPTLLIDADLRRPALGPLLDTPEGRGLSDALAEHGPDPAGLLVSVQGGTFQLLSAGTPVRDPCRLLRSRKLGSMIAGFREKYEMIIIDAPPVLPVADALVLGRWADRALFAALWDVSRIPQVKAALHRLDRAGIAVPAIVLNGVRELSRFYRLSPYTPRSAPGSPESEV